MPGLVLCYIIQNLLRYMALFVPAPNGPRLLFVKFLFTCFCGSAFFLSVSVSSSHFLWLLCTEVVTTLAAQRPCGLFPGSLNILKRKD